MPQVNDVSWFLILFFIYSLSLISFFKIFFSFCKMIKNKSGSLIFYSYPVFF